MFAALIMLPVFWFGGLVWQLFSAKNNNERIIAFGIWLVITIFLAMPLYLGLLPTEPKADIQTIVLDSWSKIEPVGFASSERFYIETEEGVFSTPKPIPMGEEIFLYYDNEIAVSAQYRFKEVIKGVTKE